MADIKIQHYRVDVGADGETLTLDTDVGSLDNAFVVMNHNRHTGTCSSLGVVCEIDDLSVFARLTDVSTITFGRPMVRPGRDIDVSLSVIEYVGLPGGANEFIVRSRNTATETTSIGGSQVVTMANTPTDIDKVVPFIQGVTSSDTTNGANDGAVLARCRGTNEVDVQFSSITMEVKQCHVTSVEFTGSNWTVGHGYLTGSGTDTGTIDLVQEADGETDGSSTPFSVTAWGETWIACWGQSDATSENGSATFPIFRQGLTDSTVDFEFDPGHNSNSDDFMVHVVSNPDLVSNGIGAAGAPAAASVSVDITSMGITDLEQSLCQIFATTDTSTAYPRGWRVIEFDSLTQLTHESSLANGKFIYQTNVIDFSGLDDSGGGALVGAGSSSVDFTAGGSGEVSDSGAGSTAVTFGSAGAGHHRLFGAGGTTAVFGASGTANVQRIGEGQTDVEFSASGAGNAEDSGGGSSSAAFATFGTGYSTDQGEGSAAVQFGGVGSGHLTAKGSATSGSTFSTTGTGRISTGSSGITSVTFGTAGSGHVASDGSGAVLVAFEAAGSGSSLAAGAGTGPAVFSLAGTGRAVARAAGGTGVALATTAVGRGFSEAAGRTDVEFSTYGFTTEPQVLSISSSVEAWGRQIGVIWWRISGETEFPPDRMRE